MSSPPPPPSGRTGPSQDRDETQSPSQPASSAHTEQVVVPEPSSAGVAAVQESIPVQSTPPAQDAESSQSSRLLFPEGEVNISRDAAFRAAQAGQPFPPRGPPAYSTPTGQVPVNPPSQPVPVNTPTGQAVTTPVAPGRPRNCARRSRGQEPGWDSPRGYQPVAARFAGRPATSRPSGTGNIPPAGIGRATASTYHVTYWRGYAHVVAGRGSDSSPGQTQYGSFSVSPANPAAAVPAPAPVSTPLVPVSGASQAPASSTPLGRGQPTPLMTVLAQPAAPAAAQTASAAPPTQPAAAEESSGSSNEEEKVRPAKRGKRAAE